MVSSRGKHSLDLVSVFVLGILLQVLLPANSEITAIMNCDNVMIIYSDGVRVAEDDNSEYDRSKIFKFPEATRLIAVHGINTGGGAGIIASFSTGLVTDKSWRCSNKYVREWPSPEFNDSSWLNAIEFKRNSVIRGPKIAKEAKWIWTSTSNDRQIYCRRLLVVQPGVIMEIWKNIPGGNLDELKNNRRYPYEPDSSSVIPNMSTPVNMMDNYGLRLTAYYKAPETGGYIFSIAGDNQNEFWLSADETSKNAKYIIGLPASNWTRPNKFNKYPDLQVSKPIPLEHGKVYFMQAFLKENRGGDHLSVKVQLPSGQEVFPLGGKNVYTGIPDNTADTAKPSMPVFGINHTTRKPTMEVRATNSVVPKILASVGASLAITLAVLLGILKYKRRKHSPEMSNTDDITAGNVDWAENEIVPRPWHNGQELADNTTGGELEVLPHAVARIPPGSLMHTIRDNANETKPASNQLKITDGRGASRGDAPQKPLEDEGCNAIPDDINDEYDEVAEYAGYEELDKIRRDEASNYHTYQKLLKNESDYVIPADNQ